MQLFKDATEDKFKNLEKGAMKHALPIDDKIYDQIKFEDHALIEWKTTLDIMMKREYAKTGLCDFSLGLEEIFTERVAIAFPRDNPWIGKFNHQ